MIEYIKRMLMITINDFDCSLITTNAARYRMVAGKHINLLEFGLRRAQGPDGGLSASKYSYIGEYKHIYMCFSELTICINQNNLKEC